MCEAPEGWIQALSRWGLAEHGLVDVMYYDGETDRYGKLKTSLFAYHPRAHTPLSPDKILYKWELPRPGRNGLEPGLPVLYFKY